MPLFSLITVTKDNLEGLKKTRASVESQTLKDFEWIVIDGASTDGTVDYLKTVPLAAWASAPDSGIYDAMNKGIAAAKGEYILFLNAGDRLTAADTLQKIEDRIQKMKTPPDFIYGDALEEVGGQNHYKPARPRAAIATGMFTHHQAMLYRRSALKGLHFNLDYKIAGDYDFTAQFLKTIHAALYCPFPLCIFESGGISQQRAKLGRWEQFVIRRSLALVSPVRNALIYITQLVLWNFRRALPGLYWALKSSGNKRPGSAQNPSPPSRPESRT